MDKEYKRLYDIKYRKLNKEHISKVGKKYYILNKKLILSKSKYRHLKNRKNQLKIWRKAGRKYWLNNIEKERSRTRKDVIKEKIAGRPRPYYCEVCDTRPSLRAICFDHCHKTNKFRGWICDNCNKVLGYVKDNSTILRKLAIYLDNFNERVKKNMEITS